MTRPRRDAHADPGSDPEHEWVRRCVPAVGQPSPYPLFRGVREDLFTWAHQLVGVLPSTPAAWIDALADYADHCPASPISGRAEITD